MKTILQLSICEYEDIFKKIIQHIPEIITFNKLLIICVYLSL